MLAQVQLPFEDSENDARQYDDERGDMGGFGCSSGKVWMSIYWHFPMKDVFCSSCDALLFFVFIFSFLTSFRVH
jgi:hypothetical protein